MKSIIPQCEPLLGDAERIAVNEYMKNPGFLTEYKKTTEFERAISEYLGVKHTIVVNNGTISLSLALLALGIKAGDKVVVPDLTMIATINAVKFIGAIPVIVDVNDRLLLDVQKTEELLKKDSSIKAVIFVSLNGRWFSVLDESFIQFCKDRNIALIDDAAQSFGSNDIHGVKIGNKCDICSFSFSMPKIITTGQGGCLTTNDDDLAYKLRRLKDFGRASGGNDIHDTFGINSKFTEFQAVIGLEQLKTINWRVERKKQIYNRYYIKLPAQVHFIPTGLLNTCPWFVDVFVDNPSALSIWLNEHNIGSRIIYPPLHTQKTNEEFNKQTFLTSSAYASTGIWLPSSLTLTDEDIDYVCKIIGEYYNV